MSSNLGRDLVPLEYVLQRPDTDAQALGHPSMVVDLDEAPGAPKVRAVADWIAATEAATLNVAGPRESTAPGIHAAARKFLEPVLAAVSGRS